MEKTLVIFNRFAHKGKLKHSYETIVSELKKSGINADLVISEFSGHAIDLTEQGVREGYKKIIVVGGDGTVNEAANGLVTAQKKGYGSAALGMIPNGRGNDFGYAVNITDNLQDCLEIIQADHRRTIDIGHVQSHQVDRYYCNGAGIGFDSAINFRAANSKLNGFASYVLSMIQALTRDFRQVPARIMTAEQTIETEILFLVAMNGKREGGGFVLAPHFDMQDGLLDVCIVGHGKKLRQLLPLIPRFFSGEIEHPDITTFKTPWVRAEILGEGLYGQTDGETLFANGKEFFAEICPEKVELICKK